MADPVTTVVVGAVGAVLGAAIQHAFKRYAEEEQSRREVIETHLLQLQNGVESLYYRMNNLRDWEGRAVMEDEYFRQSTAYVLGRVMAHESLLVSDGVYAKLRHNSVLKEQVKARLHAINWALDHPSFYHYVRVQLSEMVCDGKRIISYTEFLDRWHEPRFARVVDAVSTFVASASQAQLEAVRGFSGALVDVLAKETGVPSALELSQQRGGSG